MTCESGTGKSGKTFSKHHKIQVAKLHNPQNSPNFDQKLPQNSPNFYKNYLKIHQILTKNYLKINQIFLTKITSKLAKFPQQKLPQKK